MQFIAHWMFDWPYLMPNKNLFLLDSLIMGPNIICKFLYSRRGWVRLGCKGGGGRGWSGCLLISIILPSGIGGMVKRVP